MKKFVLLLLVCLFIVFGVLPLYGASPTTIVLTVDDTNALVNGNSIQLDVAPFIKNGRTFVPLRFVSEQLGATVNYTVKADGTVDQVTITMGSSTEMVSPSSTPTPTPLPTPTPTPTPIPPPPVEVGVIILSNSSYINSIGHTHIVGEVQNGLNHNVTYVKVIATFYGVSGNVVGTASAYTDPYNLVPGEKAPFDILWTEEIPWDHYVLKVTCE